MNKMIPLLSRHGFDKDYEFSTDWLPINDERESKYFRLNQCNGRSK